MKNEMNRDDLRYFLKQSAQAVERKLDCPDDYELASYLEGGLSEQGHFNFERHLTDCDFCMERVGLLGRANDIEADTQVPELLLARSKKLAQNTVHKHMGLRYAPRWAAAAVLVLTIGLLMNLEPPQQVSTELAPPSTSPPLTRQVRNISPYALLPQVISPKEGSTINPVTQQFVWAPVQDSLFYQVRIVNDVGDLVWQARLTGTQLGLPEDLLLASGAEYFVRVDAYLTEAKSLNSDYVVFKVGPGY
jgi:hypothetical protein